MTRNCVTQHASTGYRRVLDPSITRQSLEAKMMQPPNETHEQPQNVGKLAHFPPSYVLLVDDDPAVRNFLKRCLEGGGYITKQAGSAAEALDMIVAEAPSLVLCDIRMPGEDGLWLAERLHVRWPLIPVIMATAIDDLETVRQSRRVGA